MSIPACPLVAGDRVRRLSNTARVGIISETVYHPALEAWVCKVKFGTSIQSLPVFELERLPASGPDVWSDFATARLASPASFRHRLTYERLMHLPHPLGERYQTAQVERLGAQMIPLLKLLEAPSPRLLLTQARGTGRLVALGHVLREFLTRRQARQVLIFVPTRERSHVANAMRVRFGLTLSSWSARELRAHLLALRKGWELPPAVAVVALEALTTFDVPELLERYHPALDLLVVEGVESLGKSDAPLHKAVQALIQGADGVLLSTALPARERPEELGSLLNLLDCPELLTLDTQSLLSTTRVLSQALASLAEGAPAQALEQLDMLLDHPAFHTLKADPLVRSIRERLSAGELLSPEGRAVLLRSMEGLHPAFAHLTYEPVLKGGDAAPTLPVEDSSQVGGLVELPLEVPLGPLEQKLMEVVRWSVAALWPLAEAQERLEALLLPLQLLATGLVHGGHFLKEHLEKSTLWLDVELHKERDVEEDLWAERPPVEIPEALREQIVSRLRPLLEEPLEVYQDIRLDLLTHALTTLWAEDEATQRPARKVVLFCRTLRPLRHLAQQLTGAGMHTRLLAGVLPLDEQRIRLEHFQHDPEVKVLLCTERGGAGLDLSCAGVIIHYDLPLEPEELALRLRRVLTPLMPRPRRLVLPLVTELSLEAQVLLPLYRGLGLLTEPGRVWLEPLSGKSVLPLLREALSEGVSEAGGASASPAESELQGSVESEGQGATQSELQGTVGTASASPLQQALGETLEQAYHLLNSHADVLRGLLPHLPAEMGLRQQLATHVGPLGWPSSPELRMFLIQQLASTFPGTRLTGEPLEGLAQLDLTPAGIKAYQQWAAQQGGMLRLRAQLLGTRLTHGGFPVTFKPGQMTHESELLSPHHPMMLFAASLLQQEVAAQGRVTGITLPAMELQAPGTYALGLWRLSCDAPKEGTRLEPAGWSLSAGQPLSVEVARRLFDAALAGGEAWSPPEAVLEQAGPVAFGLKASFETRLELLRREVQALEKLRLTRRRARALADGEQRVHATREALERLKQSGAEPEQVQQVEARLRRRRELLDAQRRIPAASWPEGLDAQLLGLVWLRVQ